MTEWLNKCHFGDVRDVLRQMIADGVKVNTIVTSPPYWGLRDYGHPGQLGLEPTIGEFIRNMTEVFDLARQVLADDGTAWVNMGDSYSSRPNGPTAANATALHGQRAHKWQEQNARRSTGTTDGLKHKDLVGQPWRLAFALQDAGWWLRQDIIWAKPNPMPESVSDRCTKSHEYVFLLSKSARYYFDQEAIKEPVSEGTHARMSQNVQAQVGSARANGGVDPDRPMKAGGRGVGWGHGTDAVERDRGRVRKLADGTDRTKNNASFDAAMAIMPTTRNKRSVWTVPTESYSGAHFATFPRKLVEPCILAGCPVGGTVLDIFFGSGTTGQVAQTLGRNWIGIEINQANEPLQDERLIQPGLMFMEASC